MGNTSWLGLNRRNREMLSPQLLLRLLLQSRQLKTAEREALQSFAARHAKDLKNPPVGTNLEHLLIEESSLPESFISAVKRAYVETQSFGTELQSWLVSEGRLAAADIPRFLQDLAECEKLQGGAAQGGNESAHHVTPPLIGRMMAKKGWLAEEEIAFVLARQDFIRRLDDYLLEIRRKTSLLGQLGLYRLLERFGWGGRRP